MNIYLVAEGEVLLGEEVCFDLELGDEEERARQGSREEEGKARCQEGLRTGQLGLRGVKDEPVSVQGHQEDGEGGEEDTAGLDSPNHLAEDQHLLSPWPVLAQ